MRSTAQDSVQLAVQLGERIGVRSVCDRRIARSCCCRLFTDMSAVCDSGSKFGLSHDGSSRSVSFGPENPGLLQCFSGITRQRCGRSPKKTDTQSDGVRCAQKYHLHIIFHIFLFKHRSRSTSEDFLKVAPKRPNTSENWSLNLHMEFQSSSLRREHPTIQQHL